VSFFVMNEEERRKSGWASLADPASLRKKRNFDYLASSPGKKKNHVCSGICLEGRSGKRKKNTWLKSGFWVEKGRARSVPEGRASGFPHGRKGKKKKGDFRFRRSLKGTRYRWHH